MLITFASVRSLPALSINLLSKRPILHPHFTTAGDNHMRRERYLSPTPLPTERINC